MIPLLPRMLKQGAPARLAIQLLLTLMALLVVSLTPLHAKDAPARERIRLDLDWRFHAGDLADAHALPDGIAVTAWRWTPVAEGVQNADMTPPPANADVSAWKPTIPSEDVFKNRIGFVWYRATLPTAPGQFHRLHFETVDDSATVYLNGQKLLHHDGWEDAFDVPLDAAWRANGPNVIDMLVENTAGPGGITGPVALQTDKTPTAGGAAALNFNDRDWPQVNVPHDFVITTPFDPKSDRSHGYHLMGVGWYRKEFSLPASDQGKTLWLEFDGVYRSSKVWLNGNLLGTHQSGYTSFHYDISRFAHYGGRNIVTVRADATHNEGWWYEGGGIYRHVYLTKMAPLHVAHWGTFVTATVPNGDKGADDSADVTIKTTLTNENNAPAACSLVSAIINPTGQTVASITATTTPIAGDNPEITQSIHLPRPLLWSLEAPQLYQLRTTILQGRRIVDETETPFGIRTIRFDANQGFFLNGKPVKIQGTCNHQDFAGIGVALPDRVHIYKIEKLKQMGSNGYRCSHHPYAPEILDACDHLGMLVMDENRKLGDSPEILSQVDSMVRRDRNHPSVIMWSMCNEEGAQGTARGAQMFSAMKAVVRRSDTTRPVSCAMNGGFGQGISNVEDLQGFNYHTGDYDAFHAQFPNQPCYGSETASTLTTRGIYDNDKEKTYVTSYHLTEGAWKPIADRPWMAGGFVWTGFDYRGEPSPYDWPCINSHYGIMDTCGFPKDNYYYYLAVWRHEPIVHIMPHWNWPGQEGKNIKVICFSNCEQVELWLNGKSLGVKDMPRNTHLEWEVPYTPGRLEAHGITGGKITARDVVETTGTPANIRLETERTAIRNDSEDVAIVPVTILDNAGRTVPTAMNEVSFSLTGPGKIIGVGNGDPSSHEADVASQRHAFNGHCLVIVQSTNRAGTIQVTATAPGLTPSRVTVRSEPGASLYTMR